MSEQFPTKDREKAIAEMKRRGYRAVWTPFGTDVSGNVIFGPDERVYSHMLYADPDCAWLEAAIKVGVYDATDDELFTSTIWG